MAHGTVWGITGWNRGTRCSSGGIPHGRPAARLPIRFLPLMVFSGEGG